jgi:hypothetical protein
MDFETVTADEFGRSLTGLGVNLLSPNVRALAGFLRDVFGLSVHRLSDDFAIVTAMKARCFKLHSRRHVRGAHPVLGMVPETPPRGGRGAVLSVRHRPGRRRRVRAEAAGHIVVEPPADKPHGLRECTVLSPEGYAFSPAVHAG